MTKDEEKLLLSKAATEEAEKAHATAVEEFLDPETARPNLVGMGVGVKWTKGRPTGEPAVVCLVTQKVERNQLAAGEQVPRKLGDMQTDVLAIGYPIAEQGTVPETAPHSLRERVRPARGGYSIGHYQITAGTIGTCVYDILPGGSVSPPTHGRGIPSRFYILSNNHVLANSNNAFLGDPVLQPGPFDGGREPADRIARLSRFVPITLDPPTPRPLHRNLVDAAIAEGAFHELDRAIYWTGSIRGWRRRANVPVGTEVKKTGRTTNFTIGRIMVTNATVDVGFGGGRIGRFIDQIVTTNISAGGDSGSLVLTLDDVAVGLLFAGSSIATIVNHIEHVRSLLRVEVAESIL